MPDPPRLGTGGYDATRHYRIARQEPGEVTIDRNGKRILIAIECGNLQPGRQVLSGAFWMGVAASGDIHLPGQVLADNLPRPKDFTLTIDADIAATEMPLDELLQLREPPAEAWD